MKFTNSWLIRNRKNKQRILQRARKAANLAEKHRKIAADLNEQYNRLDSVTEVFEGQALRITQYGSIYSADANLLRGANFYQAVGGTWSGHIYTEIYGHRGERWLGTGHKRDELLLILKRWVAHGTLPKELL